MRLTEAGETVKDAGAHPYIVAALQGKVHQARIANNYQFVCASDNNFNAITAGYQLLRRSPDQPLIKNAVDYQAEPDSTLHLLLNLLNNSRKRDRTPHPQSYDDPQPLYPIIGYCENTEPGILRMAHGVGKLPIKVYRDDKDQPVFAKTFSAPGTSTSALTLQPTRLWGVHMPPGLVAEVHDQPGSPEPTPENPLVTVPASSEHIRQVYPMRLSRFALSHAARELAFGAYESNRTIMDESARTMTIQQLSQMLV